MPNTDELDCILVTLFEDAMAGLEKQLSGGLTDRPQTRGDEFAKWFAGSKIVDAAGKPVVLYHGTSKDGDFKSFRIPAQGVWFTKVPDGPFGASGYAENNDSQGYRWENGGFVSTNTASRVIPVFVKATNPKFYPENPDELRLAGANSSSATGYRREQAILWNKLRAEGHDAAVIGDFDVVVVFGDTTQIKSAVGNKNFNPTKKGMAEGR